MSRVAIDLRTNHKTGIYRYGTSLTAKLLNNSQHQYLIIYNNYRQSEIFELLKQYNNVEFFSPTDDWMFFKDSASLRAKLKSWNADLYYSTSYLYDCNIDIPVIVTIHDLIRIKYAEFSYTNESFEAKFGPLERRKLDETGNLLLGSSASFESIFFEMNRAMLKKCSKIITVSEISMKDIIKIFGIDQTKIDIIPGAIDENIFFSRKASEVQQVRNKYMIDDRYLLYIGLTHPHKRLDFLLEAFSRAVGNSNVTCKLVIIGNRKDILKHYGNIIKQGEILNNLIFLSNLSDAEVASLYTGAEALLITSIYEGFCLPALEALSCGTEVIATDLLVLRNNLGNSAHYFPIDDVHTLQEYITNIFAKKLSKKNTCFQNQFSWERSANKLNQVFEEYSNIKFNIK